MSNLIPHSTDPSIVPHRHGRGFAIVNKDGAPKLVAVGKDIKLEPWSGRGIVTIGPPKTKVSRLKHVAAALLLSVALGLSAYNLHEVRAVRDHVSHVEKQMDDVGMCGGEVQP